MMDYLKGVRTDLLSFLEHQVNPCARHLLDVGFPNAWGVTDMHRMLAASPHVCVSGMQKASPLPLAISAHLRPAHVPYALFYFINCMTFI